MSDLEEPKAWSVSAEAKLFLGILKFKPAGYNRWFNMALLTDFMNEKCDDHDISEAEESSTTEFLPTAAEIWDYRKEMYDLSQVDDFEPDAPFGMKEKECDFFLPGDFSELVKKKEDEIHKRTGGSGGPSGNFSTPMSKVGIGDNSGGRKSTGGRRKRKDSGGSSSRSSTPAGKSSNKK